MHTTWCVVRDERPYRFTAWHSSRVSARREAERLVREIGGKFYVLKVESVAMTASPPVEFVECQEAAAGTEPEDDGLEDDGDEPSF